MASHQTLRCATCPCADMSPPLSCGMFSFSTLTEVGPAACWGAPHSGSGIDAGGTEAVFAAVQNIFLTDGASVAVRMVLNAVIRDSRDAILVPIPQYPLYSAAIQIYGASHRTRFCCYFGM